MTREDDKRVAEIMGWKKIKPVPGFPSELSGAHPRGNMTTGVPRFTSDPAADYTVLEWVREHWIPKSTVRGANGELFQTAVTDDEKKNIHLYVSYLALLDWRAYEYKPGYYSRALLELDKKGVLK